MTVSSRARIGCDGGGGRPIRREVFVMLWRWMVRKVRVEVALWQCYWWAKSHGDAYSEWYCLQHSGAIFCFRILEFVVGLYVYVHVLIFLFRVFYFIRR